MGSNRRSGTTEEAGPTDARILRSRSALLKAGLELLNKNYESSLSDIASSAGVGRATLYRLFATKEDLVGAIAKDCLQRFDRETEHIEREAGSALEALRLFYRAIVPLSQEVQFLISLSTFALEDREIAQIHERQQAEMAELIELAKREGAIDPAVPTDWLVHSFDAQCYPVWVLQKQGGYPDAELADLAFRSFYLGARVPAQGGPA